MRLSWSSTPWQSYVNNSADLCVASQLVRKAIEEMVKRGADEVNPYSASNGLRVTDALNLLGRPGNRV